ncbi:MAG: magnesium transporter CorA family protein [Dehalococcoidales bacterium]|nr:magnesium transporter CorA family protein [Dehalococcoidales bacterium]
MILPRSHKDNTASGKPGNVIPPPADKPLNMKTIKWGNLTWIDISPPTERETKYLAEHYNFHQLDLDDCLSKRQLPKVDDKHKDYLFWIFHFPVYDVKKRISVHRQLTAFVGNGFLVTLHSGELWSVKNVFATCERNEEIRGDYFSRGSGYLVYQIVDQAVDHYFPILDKIMGNLDDMEDNVFNEDIEAAHELFMLRRDIIFQSRIVIPMRTVFQDLFKRLGRFVNQPMTAYFSDIIDHMNKICDTLDKAREVIEVYKDTDFLMNNYRLNRVVRVFTLISALLMPVLVISGIYGMNVVLPGGVNSGNYTTLFFLLLITMIIVAVIIFIFKRKRLI